MEYYKTVKTLRKVFWKNLKWFLEHITSQRKAKLKNTQLLCKESKGNYICVYTYLYPHIFIIKEIKVKKSAKLEENLKCNTNRHK